MQIINDIMSEAKRKKLFSMTIKDRRMGFFFFFFFFWGVEDLLSYLACIWLLLLLLLLDHNSHFGGYITKIDKNRKKHCHVFCCTLESCSHRNMAI
jgi:hypothetical protein